ncbi:gamma-glutamyltransferase [Mesobacillus subterraneus]|uniref:gamma-glutamyltransferase n=1 Tax=Mesobacillus subterraneus TaxID=285983 RepID=UPI00203FD202|nr:gamma-glutamyltransferase [Mesobacillus subterraneus]MCM3666713.1 gamma-glutamyltransferase [Mesobacillus subterraneus]MCM3685610.1 gamma-glutamyltransferase [Mesobacillus subterraneus]
MMGIFQNQKSTKNDEEEQRGFGENGMVASAVREATEVGAEVLKQGGNAMDALVAVQFALSVVEIFNTGIGANGFIIYYDNNKKETKIISGHSKAPSAVKKDMFIQKDGSVVPYFQRSTHPTAVAVPGIMKAMDTALKEFGTMPLDRLIEPAVQLAEKGFRVNWQWDQAIEILKVRMGEEAKAFFIPEGIPRVEGEWVTNEDLAKTLRILQKEGIRAIYEGEIGDAIVDTLQKMGGIMTKEDLSNYQVKIENPVTGSYKGYDLAAPPPPSAGGVTLIQILKILEGFKLEQYEISSWEKYYLLAETMRLAFSDKLAYMTDPAFEDIPEKGLLDPEYIKKRQKMIDWISRNADIDCGNPWEYQGESKSKGEVKAFKTGGETTHFTAVDKWGNVAACTSSIEHVMGSGIMVPGCGFLLNNDLTDFYPEPGHINSIEANKFPVSTKTPTIIYRDGKPFMTLGSPGGPTIIASVAQTLINIIDYHMDLKDAIEEPRIYNSTGPFIWWEEGMKEDAKIKLEDMGFEFLERAKPIGNVQAILIDQDQGRLFGAADSSRPGAAIGL